MTQEHQFVLDRLLDEFGLMVGGGRLTGMLALQARSNGLPAIDSMWAAWLKCSAPSGGLFVDRREPRMKACVIPLVPLPPR